MAKKPTALKPPPKVTAQEKKVLGKILAKARAAKAFKAQQDAQQSSNNGSSAKKKKS